MKNKGPSIEDFNKTKKPLENEDIITFYTYRKLTGVTNWIFFRLGLTPNMITFLSFLMDVIAAIFILNGNFLTSVLFIQLSILFDCCDGQMARYLVNTGRQEKGRKFGQYVDSVGGIPGLSLVVFLVGAHFHVWLGALALFTLLMLNMTAAQSLMFQENKAKTYETAKKKIFGNIKGRIGLSHDIQRLLISLALIFNTAIFMWIFVAAGTLWWLVKFWFYRNY